MADRETTCLDIGLCSFRRHRETTISGLKKSTLIVILLLYTQVKEAIHVRFRMLQHKLNIEVDIPETWMQTTRNTKRNNFATVDSDRTFSQSVAIEACVGF